MDMCSQFIDMVIHWVPEPSNHGSAARNGDKNSALHDEVRGGVAEVYHLPSGDVKVAMENGHTHSEFSHETW